MALKRKITKDDYDKLPEALKSEYVERGGEYVLDVDDSSELQRAKDRESQLRKDAEKKAKELQDKLDELSGVDAKRRGDIETLEKSWKEKHEKTTGDLTAKLTKLQEATRRSMIDGAASGIATKISTVPTLMKKAVAERLTVDFDGDEPALKILDAKGQLSALTLDELQKEFVDNKEYSAILIGSKASGGSTANKTHTFNGSSAQGDKPVSLAALSPKDLAAHLQAVKEAKGTNA